MKHLKTPALVGLALVIAGLAAEWLMAGAGAVAVGAVGTAVVLWWTRRLSTRTAQAAHEAETAAQDAAAMSALVPLLPADLPHSSWSLCPAALLRVLNEVAFREHRTVVECGSGVSSLLLGAKFRQVGAGHVWSVEHDPTWADYMRRLIARHALQDWVTLVEAPLEHTSIAGHDIKWYALDALADVRRLPRIDVLLVDGPPMGSGQLNRYGALPIFDSQLHDASLILLDDAYRPGEQDVVQAWTDTGAYTTTLWRTSRGQMELRKARRA